MGYTVHLYIAKQSIKLFKYITLALRKTDTHLAGCTTQKVLH